MARGRCGRSGGLMLKLEINGLNKAVQGQLTELDKKFQNKVIRKGLRAGGKVWQSAARGEAPVQTGKLKRSIKVRSGKRKRDSISITVGMGAKDYTGEAFYGSFIEYGYHIGKRSLGDSRKAQKANPFMQRAYDQSKDEASEAAIEAMKGEINE